MKKRILGLVLVAAMALSMLTACGGSKDAAPAPAPAASCHHALHPASPPTAAPVRPPAPRPGRNPPAPDPVPAGGSEAPPVHPARENPA